MSEDKQVRVKRTVSAPKPAAAASSEPAATLEPQTEPSAALPVPIRRRAQTGADELLATYQAALTSIGASQSAIASDVAALALEISGMARSNLTAAGDSFAALLSAKSVVDAVEIQIGFARRSLGAIAEGSTRLGEIGLRLANDAAKPVMARLSAR